MLRPTSMEKSPRIEPKSDLIKKGSKIGLWQNARITWKRGLWVGLAEHHAAHFDNVLAFPDHDVDWARVHVLDESIEEALVGKVIFENSASNLTLPLRSS